MIEAIGGLAFIGVVGYILYKMTTKKETFEQAVQETVREVKATEVKVEAAATEVKAEVAKVEAVIAEAVSVADVNKDGKVDVQDAVAVTKKVKEKAVKNVKKAAEKVRKPRAKKPTA